MLAEAASKRALIIKLCQDKLVPQRHSQRVAFGKIVVDYRVMPESQQPFGYDASYIARPASYQNIHSADLSPRRLPLVLTISNVSFCLYASPARLRTADSQALSLDL